MSFNLNQFLLGNKSFSSNTEEKQAVLLSHLALLSAGICFIYLIVDPLNGLYAFVEWYAAGLIISLIILWLNRSGKYLLSASILLLFTAAILFAIALVGNPNRGVYFFFISACITSIVLFYDRKIGFAYFFITLFIGAAIYAFLSDSPLQELLPVGQDVLQINFIINFLIGTLTTILIFLFIIKRNNESEKMLIRNKEEVEKLAEDLRVSTSRFERAVAATKAGIYEWNIESGTVYVSPSWKRSLGYDLKTELNATPEFFLSLIHPDDFERTQASMKGIHDAVPSYQNELRMRMNDGSYRWFLDSGVIENHEGKPALAVGAIIDINDRKEAQANLLDKNAALIKANDELDRFVYSASHDMRAPLSTLLGLIEVMRMTDDPTEYDRYFKMMIKRIGEMEGFITEITDYSRNTRLPLDKVQVNLHDLVNKCIESFHTLADQSNVALNNEVAADLQLKSDPTRLKVVLNNLIANAIKYNNHSSDNRYVKISALAEKDELLIKVEDNGAGIGEEHQDKIFDMFFRAADDSSGSGLGLYIVKETVAKLGGTVEFESALRQGTSFTITLPAGK
jgi:PAS domain S-box-containing protein